MAIQLNRMPKLQPVPIPTKDIRWFNAVIAWMFVIRKWVLVEEYRITIPGLGTFVIPPGFIFDGASIPKIFWALLSPTGLLLIPGLLHDYGYKYNALWVMENGGLVLKENLGRTFVDDLFYETGNYVNGLKPINWIATQAIKRMGWIAWNKHRRKNARPI